MSNSPNPIPIKPRCTCRHKYCHVAAGQCGNPRGLGSRFCDECKDKRRLASGRKRSAKWRRRNPDKVRVQHARHRARHLPRINEQKREHYSANRERILADLRDKYHVDVEKARAKAKRDYERHRPKRLDSARRRRAHVLELAAVGRKVLEGAALAGRPKKKPEEKREVAIAQRVESLMPRASQFIEIKRASQSNDRAGLVEAGFSEQEIETGLSARTAQALAREWAARREGTSSESVAKAHQRFKRQS